MDIAIITEVITALGFPIAAVIAMAWFIFRIYKKSEDREAHLMEEIKENRKINAQAIETIALYADRLTHIEDSVTEIKGDVTLIKERIN